MLSFLTTATLLATTLPSLVSAAPLVSRATSGRKSQIVTYYGQSGGQGLLDLYCNDPNIDIIPIAFVNGFPNQNGNGAYPSANFGDQCGGYANGTNLFNDCWQLKPYIQECQDKGKKILISIGGDASSNYSLAGDSAGVYFADIMWSVFGPLSSDYTGPRPFGNLSVNGFDFDIEGAAGSGYGAMANQLRSHMNAYDPTMILTAAPQCIVPDANLADAITQARFDHLYIQFYNTPYCSARAGVNYANNGNTGNDMTFDSWVSWVQSNVPAANWPQLFIGLAAGPGAVGQADQYLNAGDARTILTRFFSNPMFGGVMLYDAGNARSNPDGNYVTTINSILVDLSGGASTTTSSTVSSSATSSSTISSSTSSVITTTSSQVSSTTTTSVSTSSSATSSSTVSTSVTSSSATISSTSSSSSTTTTPVVSVSTATVSTASVSGIIGTTTASNFTTTLISIGASATVVISTTSIPVTTTITTGTSSGGTFSISISSPSVSTSSVSTTLITSSVNSTSQSSFSIPTVTGSSSVFDPNTATTLTSVTSSTTSTSFTRPPFGNGTFTSGVSSSTTSGPSFGSSTTSSVTFTTTQTSQTSVSSSSSSLSSSTSSVSNAWGQWPVGSTTSSKPVDPSTSSDKNTWKAWSTTSSRPSDPTSNGFQNSWSAWKTSSTKPADPTTSSFVQSWSAWQGTSSKSTKSSKITTSTKPADPKTSAPSWGVWSSNVYVTTTTTVYTDVCPTGFTKVTATITATVTVTNANKQPTGKNSAWPTGPAGIPAGFFVTSSVCSVGCADGPVTVAVTVPIPSIITKTVDPTQATPAAESGKPSSVTWSAWSSSTPVAAATGKVPSSGSGSGSGSGFGDPANPAPVATSAKVPDASSAKVPDSTSTKAADAYATGSPIGGYGDSPVKAFTGGAAAEQAPATIFSVAVCVVLAIAGLVL